MTFYLEKEMLLIGIPGSFFLRFFFVSFALLIGCDPLVWLDMKKRGSRLWTICRS